jgi:hypothetical protein
MKADPKAAVDSRLLPFRPRSTWLLPWQLELVGSVLDAGPVDDAARPGQDDGGGRAGPV